MGKFGNFELNEEQRRLQLAKHQQRMDLRAKFWKNMTDPHRHGAGEGGHLVNIKWKIEDITSRFVCPQCYVIKIIAFAKIKQIVVRFYPVWSSFDAFPGDASVTQRLFQTNRKSCVLGMSFVCRSNCSMLQTCTKRTRWKRKTISQRWSFLCWSTIQIHLNLLLQLFFCFKLIQSLIIYIKQMTMANVVYNIKIF